MVAAGQPVMVEQDVARDPEQEPAKRCIAADPLAGLEAAEEGPLDQVVGLGAGLAMGLAVLGSGLGQGKIAASGLEGMARNPQAGGDIRTAMLLGLAFPESLVLFALAIAFLLQGKI